jgi:two-component system response regulator MprA
MSSPALKVAIIEDDPTIRQMYQTKLVEEGFEVKTASDGGAGLDLIKVYRPNIILLDIMMPGLNGIDFLQNMRRISLNDDIKVIVLTNLDDPNIAKSLHDMGISEYVVKAETTPGGIVEKIHKAMISPADKPSSDQA